MSKIKVKGIQQVVIGETTQPLKLGGILEDNSDAKITIGTDGKVSTVQEEWITPTLLNSWVNYGSGFPDVKYMKDSMGFVHLKGLIKNGVIDTTAFVLPIGYRPSSNWSHIPVASNNLFGLVKIDINGNVNIATPSSNLWVDLISVIFKAEA